MAWSKTDTGIKAGDKDNISLPTNFSTSDPILVLEREQWMLCRDLAVQVIQSGIVGKGVGQGYTVALSGTSTAGHPLNDTVTITVTNSG